MMENKKIRNTANSAIVLIAEVNSCKNVEPFKIEKKRKKTLKKKQTIKFLLK